MLHLKLFTYTQGLSFIPAYNNTRAYSTNETEQFAFPAYKRLSFSLGTHGQLPEQSSRVAAPNQRNSFQFTMGLTYAFKSNY